MQKRGLWTRSQCRVSDTWVIIKACGPIVPGERWLRGLYNTDLIAGLYLNKRAVTKLEYWSRIFAYKQAQQWQKKAALQSLDTIAIIAWLIDTCRQQNYTWFKPPLLIPLPPTSRTRTSSRSHQIYKICWTLPWSSLLSDPCPRQEKKGRRNIAFSLLDLFGHAPALEPLPWGGYYIYNFGSWPYLGHHNICTKLSIWLIYAGEGGG